MSFGNIIGLSVYITKKINDNLYMKYIAKVWGPHYWFVLHTIALRYPKNPNDVTKKKYYDFISNLPLFIPDTKMGDEFAELLKSVDVDKPIWLTEAMTCGPPVKAWVNAFLNGAELIIDVGVNAPGAIMSKKNRKKLNEFIAEYDGFTSIKSLSKDQVEFTYNDGSSKTLEF